MRNSCLLAFCCLLFTHLHAQNDSLDQHVVKKKCNRIYIRLNYKSSKPTGDSVAAARFEVIDCRPDTTRIGLWGEGNSPYEGVFRSGTSTTLATYLNALYTQTPGPSSLLVVLKKLWLYDTVFVKQPREVKEKHGIGRIIFRGEAFLKTKEGLVPYAYLDTMITSPFHIVDVAALKLPVVLTAFVNKITAVDEAAVVKRNRLFSYRSIDSLNERRFAYPMDTAQVLREGVYASVEEFRNNQPSVFNYEVQPDKSGYGQLYLKDGEGKLYFSRKIWGYCDGHRAYMMMDGNLFPILSVDHAFYIWGSKDYRASDYNAPILVPLPGAFLLAMVPMSGSVDRKMRFFSLDVQTGQVY
jgi:hypothetical protein